MKNSKFLEVVTNTDGDSISAAIQYSKSTMEKFMQIRLTDNEGSNRKWIYPLFKITAAEGEILMLKDLLGKGKHLTAEDITAVHRKICDDKFQNLIPVINVDGVGERVAPNELEEAFKEIYEMAKNTAYVTQTPDRETKDHEILYMRYKDKDERELLFVQMDKFNKIMSDMGYSKKDIKECLEATGVLKRASGQTTYRYRTKANGQRFIAIYMDMLDFIM